MSTGEEKTGDGLVIRNMTREEINSVAIEWAAGEGWNPGLYDLDAFAAEDPEGFYAGVLNGEIIGCISVVAYKEDFSFLGFYIVKPGFRGKGYGLRIWNEAIKHLDGKNIGLDGVIDQQENYKKSGFKFEYSNIRCEGTAIAIEVSGVKDISEVPFDKLAEFDRKFFPSAREEFLKCWISQPESRGFVSTGENGINGYGVIRKCRKGHKIGPLFAEKADIAEKLFNALQNTVPGELFYLDIPEVNPEAHKLIEKYNMHKVFETARMYTKPAPELPLQKIFGVTTFELG